MKKCIEYIVFVVVLLVGRGEEGTASVSAESVSDSAVPVSGAQVPVVPVGMVESEPLSVVD